MKEALRKRPPPPALAWVERVSGGRVIQVEPLAGGIASAVHAVSVDAGGRRELVLRRFVRSDWLEPDLARREATALRAVAGAPIPTPELVAVDEDGSRCGVPAVLMTRLAGRVELRPPDVGSWLAAIAALLPPLHGSLEAAVGLEREYAPYTDPTAFAAPGWTKHPEVWARARERVAGARPPARSVAIHRDFHPANVLFARGQVSGLVDWTNACRGPGAIDVAHCRLNLAALFGPKSAERFLDAWQAEAGVREHDPRWDLLACLDAHWNDYVPWTELGAAPAPLEVQWEWVDEHLARALARC